MHECDQLATWRGKTNSTHAQLSIPICRLDSSADYVHCEKPCAQLAEFCTTSSASSKLCEQQAAWHMSWQTQEFLAATAFVSWIPSNRCQPMTAVCSLPSICWQRHAQHQSGHMSPYAERDSEPEHSGVMGAGGCARVPLQNLQQGQLDSSSDTASCGASSHPCSCGEAARQPFPAGMCCCLGGRSWV